MINSVRLARYLYVGRKEDGGSRRSCEADRVYNLGQWMSPGVLSNRRAS